MPRSSLPSHLKNLRIMEVLLTQTTEDEIRSQYKSAYLAFEANHEKYMKRISDVVGELLDGNPYSEKDWKKRPPTRHYKETFAWFGDNEDEMQEFARFSNLNHDLRVIIKTYEWPELEEMKYEVDKFYAFIYSSEKDITNLESIRFFQAKKKFEEENKEWIEEQEAIKVHKLRHHSAFTLRKMIEDEGANIDKHLECKYCKAEYEKEVESIRRLREYEASVYPTLINVVEEVPKSERKPYIKPTEQICEDCEFKSCYKSIFDDHFDKQQHKLAIWFCKACQVQSRTELEYKNHIQTKKHEKKVSGETEYFCEKCNYKTLIKQRFDQHLESKKHTSE